MSSRADRWKAPVIGAAAGLAVAAAIAGPSALASGGHAASPPAASKAANAPAASCPAPENGAGGSKGASAGPGPGAFLAAVAQMEQAGTINASQAHVLDADIQAGSIDPEQLVASGTLSSSQMHTVMDRLGAVKRSLAPPDQDSAGKAGSGKPSQG